MKWRRGLLVALVVFAALVVFELWAGRWLPPNFGALEVRRNDIRYYDVTGLYPGAGVVEFRTDEFGFRGDYGGDPARIDLLLIGNSTVREEYVTEGSTWADGLRRRFREAGHPLNIAVAANHGMTTKGLIQRFHDWFPAVPGLKARYILAYIGSNEYVIEGTGKYDRMAKTGLFSRMRDVVRNASALYAVFCWIRGRFRRYHPTDILSRDTYVPDRWAPVASRSAPLPPPSDEVVGMLAAYEQRITKLIGQIRDFGAIPIIANQPFQPYRVSKSFFLGRVNPVSGKAAPGHLWSMYFGAAAMRACHAAKAICIDTVSSFGYDAPADLYDHVHTAPQGDSKLAAFLYSQLKGVIARRPAGDAPQ